MRALVEDTKKLTVNNNNNNNNNNNSSSNSGNTVVTTRAANSNSTRTATATAATKKLNSKIAAKTNIQQPVAKAKVAVGKSAAAGKPTTTKVGKPTPTTTAATVGKKATAEKPQAAAATAVLAGADAAKTSFTNKTYKMQQQQQQTTITDTTNTNTKTGKAAANCPSPPTTGVKLRTKQTQPKNDKKENHNNNTTTGPTPLNATSTTIALPRASHANTTEEICGGVQDTIYLCNFRVSVDGEWLCLKELQDIDSNPPVSASDGRLAGSGGGGVGGGQRPYSMYSQKHKRYSAGDRSSYGGGGGGFEDNARDPAEIERSNLVNICKLVVKELLEQSVRYGRMLDSDHLPLQHFFIVIEHVLGHGLRTKKGLLGPRKELWDLLQCVESYCPEAQDITASVRDLPTVRTHIGRARAWLRIALMQKKLSDYLQALIEHREDALYEYYEPHALMMSDEIVIIMGILVGLNVIDCNLCVKEEDLDSQQGVIDFSLYLRSSSRNNDNDNDEECNQTIDANGQGNMIAVLDQKNYIEELNRHLNATVGNLQAKVESLTTTNALMKEDLAIARNSLLALQAENQAMRQNPQINAGPPSINSNQSDNSSNSKENDKAVMESLKAELEKEKKKSSELDKELKLQISLKAESDMAMKLLEKDIHEKQDTIVSLRLQLDEIKQINLEMYRKLQECEAELTQKGEMVARLQTKASQIGNILQSLEKKYEQQHSSGSSFSDRSPSTRRQQNLQKFEALTKKHKQDIGPPMKRLHLKMDGIPPFNPNNYRKSPSTTEKFHESIGEVKTPLSAKSLKLSDDDEDTIGASNMPPASLPNNAVTKSDYLFKEEKAAN